MDTSNQNSIEDVPLDSLATSGVEEVPLEHLASANDWSAVQPPSMLGQIGQYALKKVGEASKTIDSYTGAPVRAAVKPEQCRKVKAQEKLALCRLAAARTRSRQSALLEKTSQPSSEFLIRSSIQASI